MSEWCVVSLSPEGNENIEDTHWDSEAAAQSAIDTGPRRPGFSYRAVRLSELWGNARNRILLPEIPLP